MQQSPSQEMCHGTQLPLPPHSSRWESPDGERFRYDSEEDYDDSDDDRGRRRSSSRRGERRKDDYRVRVDNDECSLTIRRFNEEDEGPWLVTLEDEDNDEEQR